MVRTVGREHDLEGLFPELGDFRRTAVRLHPYPVGPGRVSPRDSSVGGPLLWPADEPWPRCELVHEVGVHQMMINGQVVRRPRLTTPSDARLGRQVLEAARRSRAVQLTAEERAVLDRIRDGADVPPFDVGEPVTMVSLAQVFARDAPGYAFPTDRDLLQVLWCPFEHPEVPHVLPLVVWRREDEVGVELTARPEPATIQSADFLPRQCLLRPEAIEEYPAFAELPVGLALEISSWLSTVGISSWGDFAQFWGWKLGGWEHWSQIDPRTVECERCGTRMEPLFCVTGSELLSGVWATVDEDELTDELGITLWEPTDVRVGRGSTLQVYRCPVDVDHPTQHLLI